MAPARILASKWKSEIERGKKWPKEVWFMAIDWVYIFDSEANTNIHHAILTRDMIFKKIMFLWHFPNGRRLLWWWWRRLSILRFLCWISNLTFYLLKHTNIQRNCLVIFFFVGGVGKSPYISSINRCTTKRNCKWNDNCCHVVCLFLCVYYVKMRSMNEWGAIILFFVFRMFTINFVSGFDRWDWIYMQKQSTRFQWTEYGQNQ